MSDLVQEKSIDILCMNETKIDDSIPLIPVPDYKLIRKDRNKNGGGVAILIRKGFE